MTELYSFVFCMLLGMAARLLFMLTSLIAKRTDLMPVTVVLDFLTAVAVGGAFTAYVILSGATLAPYMFAALGASYLLTYRLTVHKRGAPRKKAKKEKTAKQKKNCPNA